VKYGAFLEIEMRVGTSLLACVAFTMAIVMAVGCENRNCLDRSGKGDSELWTIEEQSRAILGRNGDVYIATDVSLCFPREHVDALGRDWNLLAYGPLPPVVASVVLVWSNSNRDTLVGVGTSTETPQEVTSHDDTQIAWETKIRFCPSLVNKCYSFSDDSVVEVILFVNTQPLVRRYLPVQFTAPPTVPLN
jgi:hypothetical protein